MDTYVISLERSTDRREHMLSVMLSAGITFEFWKATDGLKLTIDEIEKYICQDSARKWSSKKRPLSLGEIGCAVSHITLWKHLVATRTPIALILEDDIVIKSREIKTILNKIETRLRGPDVVLLNCDVNSTWIFQREELTSVEVLHRANGKANLTSAYVITLAAAQALVERIGNSKLGFPIDCWCHQSRDSFATTVHTRVVLPNPVEQVGNSLPSTIGNSLEQKSQSYFKLVWNHIRNTARCLRSPSKLRPDI